MSCRTNQQVREELDRNQDGVNPDRQTRRHGDVLEEAAQALALDTNTNPGQVCDASQCVGATGVGEGGQLNKRNRTEEVVHQNEEEGGEQNRHERLVVLNAQGFLAEGVTSKHVAGFSNELSLAGNHGTLTCCGEEEDRNNHHGQQNQYVLLTESEITNGEEGGQMHVFRGRRHIGFREDQPVLDQSKSFLATSGYQEPMSAYKRLTC